MYTQDVDNQNEQRKQHMFKIPAAAGAVVSCGVAAKEHVGFC